jgi:hypothetical protein
MFSAMLKPIRADSRNGYLVAAGDRTPSHALALVPNNIFIFSHNIKIKYKMANRQQQEQQQQQQERRRNLRLDFTRPYERAYNQQRGETRPLQSGFVSSTKWSPQDLKWYKSQINSPSMGNIQENQVTCGRDETTKYLRESLGH